jgi:hypothetical protein
MLVELGAGIVADTPIRSSSGAASTTACWDAPACGPGCTTATAAMLSGRPACVLKCYLA